jgi:hypothetical protein
LSVTSAAAPKLRFYVEKFNDGGTSNDQDEPLSPVPALEGEDNGF